MFSRSSHRPPAPSAPLFGGSPNIIPQPNNNNNIDVGSRVSLTEVTTRRLPSPAVVASARPHLTSAAGSFMNTTGPGSAPRPTEFDFGAPTPATICLQRSRIYQPSPSLKPDVGRYQNMRESNLNPSWDRAPPPPQEDGDSMGKRMITVEVTGMQSAALRSGKVTIAKPQDLEAEGSAILEAYHERQAGTHNDGALMHTAISGKVVDATTDAVVLEVYPFVVRTSLTATQTDMFDWVGAVREELAAGVHPAPCALYARRVSKGVDTAVPSLSGADVLSAAKALLGDTSTTTNTIAIGLQWSLHIQGTVAEAVKIKKEIVDPSCIQEEPIDHVDDPSFPYARPYHTGPGSGFGIPSAASFGRGAPEYRVVSDHTINGVHNSLAGNSRYDAENGGPTPFSVYRTATTASAATKTAITSSSPDASMFGFGKSKTRAKATPAAAAAPSRATPAASSSRMMFSSTGPSKAAASGGSAQY